MRILVFQIQRVVNKSNNNTTNHKISSLIFNPRAKMAPYAKKSIDE